MLFLMVFFHHILLHLSVSLMMPSLHFSYFKLFYKLTHQNMFKLKVRVCKRKFITIINTRNFIISIICKTCRKLLYKSHRTFISQIIQCIIGLSKRLTQIKTNYSGRNGGISCSQSMTADWRISAQRFTAMYPRGKTFTTIFLQVKCFSVPPLIFSRKQFELSKAKMVFTAKRIR